MVPISIAKQAEPQLRNIGKVVTSTVSGGASMPTSSKLDKMSSLPKGTQPTPEKSETSETQLHSRALSSDSSPLRAIAGQTVLSKLFLPGLKPAESSAPSHIGSVAQQGLTDPTETTPESLASTHIGRVVQGALTQPLTKLEPSENHISQVLSPASHKEDLMGLCHDIYSLQPAYYPLSTSHARAMHTLTPKDLRSPIHKVEDPAIVKVHLDKFRRDGAVCLIPAAAREKFCKTHLGHAGDNAQFVLNKGQFDEICKIVGRAGGTRAQMEARLEELCGIPKGSWKDLYVAEYKEKNLDKLGLRFVSGKETLANDLYGAGGVTHGTEGMSLGMDEAILNRVSVDEVTWWQVTEYIASKMETASKSAPKPEPEPSVPVSSMSVQYPTVMG